MKANEIFFENLFKLIQNVDESNYESYLKPKSIVPRNPISKTVYRGSNGAYLYLGNLIGDICTDCFSTFKQIQQTENLELVKGSTSEKVLMYGKSYKNENGKSIPEKVYQKLSTAQKEKTKENFFVKYYNVFGYDNINGEYEDFKVEIPSIQEFKDSLPVEVNFRNVRNAMYRSSECGRLDEIVLPPKESFVGDNERHHAFFHELTHWTGHESRLNRKVRGKERNKEAYAYEELVAEIGAMMLSMNFNIQENVLSSCFYLKRYLEQCNAEDDKKIVQKAFMQAQKAVSYLLNFNKKEV